MIFIFDNNRGSVMSIALLMLVLLTTIVIFMSRNSTTDVEIAANDRYSTTAFYIADAGAYGQAKIVGKTLDLGRNPVPVVDLPGMTVAETYIASDFYDQVMGFGTDTNTTMAVEPTASLPSVHSGGEDLQFQLNNYEINVDIANLGTTALFGGGAEFGAGSIGVGAGSAGGVAINFEATALGEGPKNSRSTVVVQYRKIPGTAGGL